MIVIKSIIKRVFLWPWRGICFYAILFLMAMMGFGLILFLTDGKGIIGLRYDTFNFFLIAKWFIDPGYFSKGDYWLLDEVRASLHRFPPFFSAILAGFTKIGGHDFLSTLRWVYASLLGVNIILVGLILKGSIKSFWLVFLGIVWIFVSIDMLDLHSLALSEALFVFLMLVWFKYLMDFINNSKTSSYFICFFIIGLACITRWAGLTLFITSMFSIHIFKKKVKRGHFVVATLLAILPSMTWRILTNDVLGEGFEFHHINWAYFNISSAFTVWQGEYLSYFLGRNTWLIMMVVMYLTGYYLWQRRNPELIKQFPLGAVSLIAVSFVFIVVYVLGMVMVVLFLDSGAMPQARYLLPLRVIVVFLYLAFVYVVASLNDKARQARIIFISTCSFAIIIGNIVAVSGWVKERHSKGVLLNGVDWVGSEIVTEIRKMPSNTVIYSNNAKAVYLLAERVATLVDSKEDLKNDGFVQRMRGDFRRGKGMFVFCNQRYDGCNDLKCGALTMDDIQAKLSLRLLRRLKDGAIYIWDSSAD